MSLPVSTLNNISLYLRYPKLPEVDESASSDVQEYAGKMQGWYNDFVKIIQRDREEIIASIKKITP